MSATRVLVILIFSVVSSAIAQQNKDTFILNEKLNFTVLGTFPPQSDISGGGQIQVQGDHFYESPNLKCAFIHRMTHITTATFISSDLLVCTAPTVNSTGNYFLEVSENGVNFTNNQVVFIYVHNDKKFENTGVIMGVVILVILFSLTATAVGVYFWRKKNQTRKEKALYGEQSFSLLPGMTNDPRRNDL
eukprot:Phypoly_transcript_19115.p1 GENE.Phypoly_transcript_19115~~Phypoly_transcript_19115.p1  ORF type:complete len:213 (+),score=17.08 Phypoly_transcript_19115:71-640(+)